MFLIKRKQDTVIISALVSHYTNLQIILELLQKVHGIYLCLIVIHGKNAFIEVFKNLTRYKSENNFVGLSK